MSGLCIIILLGIRIIPTSLCLSDQTRCLLAGIEQNAFETGVLLVSSRYYDPEVGRWITPEPNAYEGEFDENAGLIGYNVYAYCANNPVNNLDPTGEFLISTAVLIGIGIGALTGGVAGGAYGYNKAVKSNVPKGQHWKYVVGYGLGGAVIGGVIGGFVGYGVGVALGQKPQVD